MKRFFARKKLMAVLLALVLIAAAMAGVAFADNANVQPMEENTATHGYVKDIKICGLMSKYPIPDFSFDPATTEYNVTLPDTATIPNVTVAFNDNMPDNLYAKIVNALVAPCIRDGNQMVSVFSYT